MITAQIGGKFHTTTLSVVGSHVSPPSPHAQRCSGFETFPEDFLGQGRCLEGLKEGDVDRHRLQHLRHLPLVVRHRVVLKKRLHLRGFHDYGKVIGVNFFLEGIKKFDYKTLRHLIGCGFSDFCVFLVMV